MFVAKKVAIAASSLVLTLFAVAPAMAQLDVESPQTFGRIRIDMLNGRQTSTPNQTDATGDVYNNSTPQAPANFGFSSTDLNSTFGDRVNTTGTGLLQENDFTIFNSGSSAGPLLTATYLISFFDGPSGNPLGAYQTTVNFGAGLPAGFFAVVTATNLNGLNINLNTQDVIVTQKLVNKTGAANRLGIASFDPPNIGSSANTMFVSSSTVGPPGFYNIGNPPQNANPGYRINVNQATPATPRTWGKMKALYHS